MDRVVASIDCNRSIANPVGGTEPLVAHLSSQTDEQCGRQFLRGRNDVASALGLILELANGVVRGIPDRCEELVPGLLLQPDQVLVCCVRTAAFCKRLDRLDKLRSTLIREYVFQITAHRPGRDLGAAARELGAARTIGHDRKIPAVCVVAMQLEIIVTARALVGVRTPPLTGCDQLRLLTQDNARGAVLLPEGR